MTREEAIEVYYGLINTKIKEAFEFFAPELAESEDERIRKIITLALIATEDELSAFYSTHNITRNECTDWLEKQKESLHISETCKENADSFTDDEKIRKALISLVDENAYTYKSFAGVDLDSMLVYLEKQKAKERLDRMAPIYNDKESFESALEKAWKYYNESASRKVDSLEDDYIECVFSKGFREGFLYKEKQKEQKPNIEICPHSIKSKSYKENGYPIEDCNYGLEIAENILEKTLGKVEGFQTDDGIREHQTAIEAVRKAKEQMPAAKVTINGEPVPTKNYSVDVPLAEWSEEDGKMRDSILAELANHICYNKPLDGMLSGTGWTSYKYQQEMNWLKSLRPQPKQEWNDEDEKMLEEIINHIYTTSVQRIPARPGSDIGKSWIKFLKSLRPQPHWKPSEEQMEALQHAIDACESEWTYQDDELRSLLNELKKLGVKEAKEESEYYQQPFNPDC